VAPIEIPRILPKDCRRVKVVEVLPNSGSTCELATITKQYDVCALVYNGVLLVSGPVDQVDEVAPKLGSVDKTLYEGCDYVNGVYRDLCINIYTIK